MEGERGEGEGEILGEGEGKGICERAIELEQQQ